MLKDTHDFLREITELAEGSSEEDQRDPKSCLETATMPIVQVETSESNPAAETGNLSVVGTEAEGAGESVEDQDASQNDDEIAPVKSEAPAVEKSADSERPTVLILEDTTELAEVLQATLENMDIRSEWVSHGSKGLDRLKDKLPDLILLDIGLPDMTGWKVLEEMREWENQIEMPKVIVITAYGDPANRLIGKLQGIHSYLIKPFTPSEVESVVSRALSGTA